MIASLVMKDIDPSRKEELMKVHMIMLTARKGRNCSKGESKISPKTAPIAKIWTAIPRVNQNGPKADLR
jgi:hypothetical protein